MWANITNHKLSRTVRTRERHVLARHPATPLAVDCELYIMTEALTVLKRMATSINIIAGPNHHHPKILALPSFPYLVLYSHENVGYEFRFLVHACISIVAHIPL